jgi:CheY-like chemotaxis protein
MKESILQNKIILAVDDSLDVLTVLEEEILEACPTCRFDKATTYYEAVERIVSLTYDIVLLDILGVRGLDLVELAISRNFPVAIFTAHPFTPEFLKHHFKMEGYAYLPKERLGEVVPFLETILRYEYLSGWGHLFKKITGFLGDKFEFNWKKKPTLNQQDQRRLSWLRFRTG